MLTPATGIAVVVARGWTTGVAAVAGLAIGSFLNVVVYRVPRGLSVVAPGSFCPACATPIRSVDNVPLLSWLVLRGRCRSCGEPISPRYPLVELATAVVFGAVAWGLGSHWAVPGMCILAATALALAAVELDGMHPPGAVALVGGGIGLALLAAAAVADSRWWHLGGALIGTAVAAVVIATSAWRRRPARQRGGDGQGEGADGPDDGDGDDVPWAVLPAGVVLGWVGFVGPLVGIPVAAVALVVLRMVRPRQPAAVGGGGVALAAAAAEAAAIIAALVAGTPIGR